LQKLKTTLHVALRGEWQLYYGTWGSKTGKHASYWQPGADFADLELVNNDDRTRYASDFPGLLETSLPGSLHEGSLRLMKEFRPFWISAPTITGVLQIAPDPGKRGVFSVYNYR
jgi:hypothetical protein